MSFPEAAARLLKGDESDDDEEFEKTLGEDEKIDPECDAAWKARLKVCKKIAQAREDLCASRRRITKAQKQIHNLKVAARQVHLKTLCVTTNLTKELFDHHSSGMFDEAGAQQTARMLPSPLPYQHQHQQQQQQRQSSPQQPFTPCVCGYKNKPNTVQSGRQTICAAQASSKQQTCCGRKFYLSSRLMFIILFTFPTIALYCRAARGSI
ncbi:uncharacterized protein LOC142328381 [Lycorma delicatula]|uniref:uncharacterized protein LOC142328381 n=1 Tax=Lycorma delicatula TaxID=130591 RepID=UPI003F512D85